MDRLETYFTTGLPNQQLDLYSSMDRLETILAGIYPIIKVIFIFQYG